MGETKQWLLFPLPNLFSHYLSKWHHHPHSSSSHKSTRCFDSPLLCHIQSVSKFYSFSFLLREAIFPGSWAPLNVLFVMSLISLYLGNFSGLCLQQATLRDNALPPLDIKCRLAYCLPRKHMILWAQCFSAIII